MFELLEGRVPKRCRKRYFSNTERNLQDRREMTVHISENTTEL